MQLSVQIETLDLTWARWKDVIVAVEELGYSGLYLCDHFAAPVPVDIVSIDAWTALTYAADRSQRMRFGPLVSPVTFRDPIILARQAMDLYELSGGRFVLGVGAGWAEREHRMFGWQFGGPKARTDRFAEALEVITGLCRSPEPFTFEGQFYTLRDAKLLPQTAGMPLQLASWGGNRSLTLAARHADILSTDRRPASELSDIYARLDQRLAARGRNPSSVRRTVMVVPAVYRDTVELETRTLFGRKVFAPRPMSATEFADWLRARGDLAGTPDEVVDQIRTYAQLGVDELMLDMFDNDMEHLRLIAEEVLPRVAAFVGDGQNSARATTTRRDP